MVLAGVVTGFYLTTLIRNKISSLKNWVLSHYSLCTIWFLVPLSSQFILKWPMVAAHWNIKYVDQGWLESMSGIRVVNKLSRIRNTVYTYRPKNPIIYLSTFIIIVVLTLVCQF
jgi:hypothetical protein